MFSRLRDRQTTVPVPTRNRGQRTDPHSKLLVLSETEVSSLEPLIEMARTDERVPTRCGQVELGCRRSNFEFDFRLSSEFNALCDKLIRENARDNRVRRITSSTISTYTTTLVCSTRDNRVMMGVHRDDGTGDDISLIFGLSVPQDFSGGLLRVGATKSGDVWRRRRESSVLTEKSGSVTYDIFLGRCCVLQNPEHSVQRMHWGRRSVAIVTAKPMRFQN